MTAIRRGRVVDTLLVPQANHANDIWTLNNKIKLLVMIESCIWGAGGHLCVVSSVRAQSIDRGETEVRFTT